MSPAKEEAFKEGMLKTYREAFKLGYKATYFLRMVNEMGAVPAAKRLIHDPNFSSGFTQLWELKRLDLSVEALVLQPQWQELFDDQDRKAAREKLAKLNYTMPT